MAGKSITLYCYYAPVDHKYILELKKHLASLEKQGWLIVWHDGDIDAGTDFINVKLSRLNNADVILIFVSPDFVASDACFSPEMRQSVRRHISGEAHIIPIYLRPAHWQETPFYHIQPLPKNGEPVTSKSWFHLDEALFDVTQGIRAILQKLLGDELNMEQHVSDQEAQPAETRQVQKNSWSQFNMEGQIVMGNQYNASRDMHIKLKRIKK
jgi:hypothetical protein